MQPYLLEHALDSIIERGEIHDVQLITEMICQTIAQSDYARTLHLMNVMTENSIDINELQWSNLLQQNMHRFSVNALKDLLTYLSTSDTIKSGPALSFVRVLQSQCGTTLVKDTCFLADGSDTEQIQLSLPENVGKSSSSNLTEQDQLTCKNSLDTDIFPDEKVSSEFSDCNIDTPQLGANAGFSGDIVLRCSPSENKQKEHCDLEHWGTHVSAIDEVLDSMSSCGDSSYEKMPSASDILELWEQERINDMFAPKKKVEPL